MDATLPRPGGAVSLAVGAWAVVLAVVLLGPALGVGYVLSYDMVWVPDLALRPDLFGTGSALPRAVPSDAVVAVLDEVVPGMVLQKAVLLGALVGAGVGAARLVGDRPVVARLVVVSFAIWNPFTTERLVLGAWPVLVGYGVLPWLVVACRSWRAEGRFPRRLLVLVPLGCLSPSAGIATAVVLVALAAGRGRSRAVVVLLAAAEAPWLVTGLLHAGSATTDARGAQVFATSSEGSLVGPLAALGLGGIWNSEVVPTSRSGVLGWLATGLLLVLLLLAAVRAVRAVRNGRVTREPVGLAICWAVGWGLATTSWAAPDALGWLATHLPGGGVVRDGSRLLLLCLPLLVVVVADVVTWWWGQLPRPPAARVGWGLSMVLAPVALLPDVAWGVSGRLDAVSYPATYGEARDVVATLHGNHGGDVLLLPASSYRQPSWNGGRKVLDPTGRYLTPDYVANDVLVVGGVELAGEDPRAREVLRALSAGDPEQRARDLTSLGIGFVVEDRGAPGQSPAVAGEVVLDAVPLRVVSLGPSVEPAVPAWWVAAAGTAWVVWCGLFFGAGLGGAHWAARWSGRRAPSRRIGPGR